MNPTVRLARTAGLYYLAVAVLGGFAHAVRTQVYVAGDAAATLQNVQDHSDLVRLSFTADLTSATFMVFLVLALSRLVGHVDRTTARLMVLLVTVFVAIICLNLVSQFGALAVATDPAYGASFGPGGTAGLVLLLMELQHTGYLVAQIFFGLWLLPLGRLVLGSGLFPRPLGFALIVAAAAYVVDVAIQVLAPGDTAVVSGVVIVPIVTLAEVSMLVYLLVRGIRSPTVARTAPTERPLVPA